MERGRIQGLSKFFEYPLLSQQRVKLQTSNFVGTFIGSTGTKAHENIGNNGRGRSQGVPKFFRAPICMAHCEVIFAIPQLSCRVCQCAASHIHASLSMVTLNRLSYVAAKATYIRLLHGKIGFFGGFRP